MAAALIHESFDLESFRIVDEALRSEPLDVYETLRWPYPPGFFPFVVLAGSLTDLTGIDPSVWIKLPSIAADLAIVWVVQALLARNGFSQRSRLVAAALVSFGPSFFVISGYEGQIDAVAILPAVLALYWWKIHGRDARTETIAALLVGIGGAMKTVPLLFVAVFAAAIPTWGRRLRFGVLAFAVPAVLLVPWIIGNPSSLSVLRYSGFPGVGGISLALQPNLPSSFLLTDDGVTYSSLTSTFSQIGTPLLLLVLGSVALVLIVRCAQAERAATLLWLTVYTFIPSFFFQYVVWGLPVFLAAGYLPQVAVAQFLLAGPLLIWVLRPWEQQDIVAVYSSIMTLTWAGTAMAFALQLRKAPQRSS